MSRFSQECGWDALAFSTSAPYPLSPDSLEIGVLRQFEPIILTIGLPNVMSLWPIAKRGLPACFRLGHDRAEVVIGIPREPLPMEPSKEEQWQRIRT